MVHSNKVVFKPAIAHQYIMQPVYSNTQLQQPSTNQLHQAIIQLQQKKSSFMQNDGSFTSHAVAPSKEKEGWWAASIKKRISSSTTSFPFFNNCQFAVLLPKTTIRFFSVHFQLPILTVHLDIACSFSCASACHSHHHVPVQPHRTSQKQRIMFELSTIVHTQVQSSYNLAT